MNNFTNFIKEEWGGNKDSSRLLSDEIGKYLKSVKKIVPNHIQEIIYLTQKYGLLDAESIESIRNASRGQLKRLSGDYDIPYDEIESLWKAVRDIKGSQIRLLPQYQSDRERKMVELGKLSMDDLTIDLTSQAGRNAAAKIYTPIVYKIANQYAESSRLSKQELISAGLQGLADAINDWKKASQKEDENTVAFKTYVSYRVKQQILNDINQHGHSLSGTSWYSQKISSNSELDAKSLDSLVDYDTRSGESKYKGEYERALATKDIGANKDDSKHWEKLFDLLDKNFRQRELDVFYRYFGLNGYKKEKSKDIAKSLGVSEGAIRNMYINKIIAFLRKDKRAMELLSDIQDMYTESLMIEMFGLSKEDILETLINDDIFILLEELNKWKDKKTFKIHCEEALSNFNKEDGDIIINMLDGDFETIDSQFKKYKKIIILFLSNMYPTESFTRKSDVYLIDCMLELQEFYKKYKSQ